MQDTLREKQVEETAELMIEKLREKKYKTVPVTYNFTFTVYYVEVGEDIYIAGEDFENVYGTYIYSRA